MAGSVDRRWQAKARNMRLVAAACLVMGALTASQCLFTAIWRCSRQEQANQNMWRFRSKRLVARRVEPEKVTDAEHKIARDMLRDAPVGQMASAAGGEEGAQTLYLFVGGFFLVMLALTAAVLSGAL
eukprot:TRINITY_DN62928_c0_g1_i1.p1 TRINITY_DN62928_c0_g1~~TRINITY_DN62928_c0_g1_i1.p1  ORF type:complete len:127 (+),score=20.04 TRINITY_DN62928_c0_g1_i1:54-434(+)